MRKNESETNTENLFRQYYGAGTYIEKSAIPKEYGFISKGKNPKGDGYPDFFLDTEDYVIVVEAKKTDHNKAEQEVKYYMQNNTITKDIIGIAVSGKTEAGLQVTYYIQEYATGEITEIDKVSVLISMQDIKKVYRDFKYKNKTTDEHLTNVLKSLNTQFQNEDIVRDTERSLFFFQG